jgi:hypothetical protein
MNHVELAVAAIAGRQHQVFSRAQAIAAGLSSSSLDRRVQSELFVPCGVHTLRFCGTVRQALAAAA